MIHYSKTILVALLLACLTFIPASAQTSLRIGLKGGTNLTSFSFSDDVFESSNRTGFFVGPTLKLSLPLPGVSFDLSAFYNQREGKATYSSTGEVQPTEVTLKQKSIDVPLNIRYTIGLGDVLSIFAAVGPQMSFTTGDKEFELSNINWKLKDSYFSVNVGGGIGISKLEIGVNYNIGISNTGDVEWDEVKDKTFHAHHKTWQVSLAYYF